MPGKKLTELLRKDWAGLVLAILVGLVAYWVASYDQAIDSLVVGLILENAFQARRGLVVTSREVEERGGVSLDHGGKRIQIQHVGHPANRFVDASPSQAYVDDDLPEARFEQARGELHRPLPGSARRLEASEGGR